MRQRVKLFLMSTVLLLLCVAPVTLAAKPNSSVNLVAASGSVPQLNFRNTQMQTGVRAGWGSHGVDNAAIAMQDPDDPDNTVLKLGYNSTEDKEYTGFFRNVVVEGGTYYEISLDFKTEGDVYNFGLRFNNLNGRSGFLPDHSISGNSDQWTDIADREGWKNYTFYFYMPTLAETDRIEFWFGTGRSEDNYVLVDNLFVRPVELIEPGFKYRVEGESIDVADVVYENEDDLFNYQHMVHWHGGEPWGGGYQFVWDPKKEVDGVLNPVGETLEYTLNVPEAGDYEVTIAHTKAGDFAIIQYYINDVKIGEPIDFYDSAVNHSGPISLGEVALLEGENTVKVEIVGRNPLGHSFFLYGLDWIEFKNDDVEEKDPVFSDELGDNIALNGDFEGFLELAATPNGHFDGLIDIGEWHLPDPHNEYHWATWFGDSRAKLIIDPDDETNHVMKIGFEEGRANFANFVNIMDPEPGPRTVSIDFKFVGEEFYPGSENYRNIALFFDIQPEQRILAQQDQWVPVEGKEGWYTFSYETEVKGHNILRMHIDTQGSPDNYILVDNVRVEAPVYDKPTYRFIGSEFAEDDIIISHGRHWNQGLGWFHTGAQWLKKDHLNWVNDDDSALVVGATMELTIDVPEAGNYTLVGSHTVAGDFGKVSYTINGELVDKEFDFYSPDLGTRRDTIGTFDLLEGENTILVTQLEKNAESTGMYYGLDYLEIRASDAQVTGTKNMVKYSDFDELYELNLTTIVTEIPEVPVVQGPAGGFFSPAEFSTPVPYLVEMGNTALKFEYTTSQIASLHKLITYPVAGKYTLNFDVEVSEGVETIGFRQMSSINPAYSYHVFLLQDGVRNGTWEEIDGQEGWYNVTLEIDTVDKYANVFEFYVDLGAKDDEGKNENFVNLDNLAIYFKNQPTGFPRSANTLRDGEFSLFDDNVVLSNVRSNGWQTRTGDSPAVVRNVNGNKLLSFKAGAEDFTRANLEIPARINAGALITLEFDFQYSIAADSMPTMKVALAAGNKEYFTIDLLGIVDGSFTGGEGTDYYRVTVTPGDGNWQRVSVDLPLSEAIFDDLDFIEFTFASENDKDELQIDNVGVYTIYNPTPTSTPDPDPDPDPTPDPDPDPTPTPEPKDEGANLTWLWVSIAAIVGIGAGGVTVFFVGKKVG